MSFAKEKNLIVYFSHAGENYSGGKKLYICLSVIRSALLKYLKNRPAVKPGSWKRSRRTLLVIRR